YGLAESVANISESPEGKLMVDEDFSLVEFQAIEEIENSYRIIGTNWSNPAFPLFKYDTGDVAYSTESLLDIKKTIRLVERIDGRIDDYISLPDGRRIGRLADVFRHLDSILEAQIHQSHDYSLTIKLVSMPGNREADTTDIERLLHNKLGIKLPIKFLFVDSIPKTKSGKLRLVTSDIYYIIFMNQILQDMSRG